MDPQQLLQCFASTLEPSQAIREQAETRLRELARTPGFLGASLDIIAADAPPPVRKAAAVYFKNRIVRFWRSTDDAVDAGEKPVVKDRLVRVLAHVDQPTKHQLTPVLRLLVSTEGPTAWPALLVHTGELLKSDQLGEIYTGVLCFAEIARHYRWVTNAERAPHLDPLIVEVFPHLLNVGNALVALPEPSELSAEVLKLILKAYKFVTYFDFPEPLQSTEALESWGAFHVAVIRLPAPKYVMLGLYSSEAERDQTQFAKAAKWAVANMERMFRRYASRDLSLKMKYDGLRAVFAREFVPRLMLTYLLLIEEWCAGSRWVPQPALYHLLEFLAHAVTQKDAWALLKPYFETLVSHFIYPLLCPSDDTLELFDVDPVEYINSKLDNFDDLGADVAALGLLVTLAQKRGKTTLAPILSFAHGQLQQLTAATTDSAPESVDIAKKKDGAMRLVGAVAHLLTQQSSPYKSEMEQFLSAYILPALNSPHEFLRARALDVVLRFADVDFVDPAVMSVMFHGILLPFSADLDESLPVRLQASLAIQAYISNPHFQKVLGAIIVPTMLKFIELSNEIDNDAVSMVMQECVENFAEQLQPFGVDLMKSLVQQFMRLAAEMNEVANLQVNDLEDDADYPDTSDKAMAAGGLLNTMITILLLFNNSKEVCVVLEETFSPVIRFVLTNELDDFITEIGELMENSIFLFRAVTPLMWTHFDLLANSFNHGIALMYTEELSQVLRNFMVFGQETLAQLPELSAKFVTIIMRVIEGEEGSVDRDDIVLACELALTLVLSLLHNSPPFIAELNKTILPVLASNQPEQGAITYNTLTVYGVDYVVSCLLYDAQGTLDALLENQHFASFFDQWWAVIPQMRRLYDIKLSILGLVVLLNSPQLLESVPNVAVIGSKLALLLKELPNAIQSLEKQRQVYNLEDFGGHNFGDADFETDDEIDDDYDENETSGAADQGQFLNFLKEENNKLSNWGIADEDGVYEDPLATTPLDAMDAVAVFKDFAVNMQLSLPAVYSLVFENVSETETAVFRDAFA